MTIWICETCNQKVISVEGVSTVQSVNGFYHTMCCKSHFSDGKHYVSPKSPGKLISLYDWQCNYEKEEHNALKIARSARRAVDHAQAVAAAKRSIAAEAHSGMVAGVGDPKLINPTAVKRLKKEAELALKEVKEKIDKWQEAESVHNETKKKWLTMLNSLKQ